MNIITIFFTLATYAKSDKPELYYLQKYVNDSLGVN